METQPLAPVSITVQRSGIIDFQVINDAPDGTLTVIEGAQHVPFAIQRVYYIANIRDPGAVRGQHAHRTLSQVICCLAGSFRLTLDDGAETQQIRLQPAGYGILLGPGLWHVMDQFSADCVVLVCASAHYREADYIRDYQDFLNFVHRT